MTGSLQRIRDEIARWLLGFSPFEMEDDMRRLQRLVERLREEHAREVEHLRAELRRVKGEARAAGDNGDGRKHLPQYPRSV